MLDASTCVNNTKGEGTKPFAPPRVPIQIRETVNGGITLVGVTEAEVRTTEEMTSYLSRGSLARATGSTNMNSQSRYKIDKIYIHAHSLSSDLLYVNHPFLYFIMVFMIYKNWNLLFFLHWNYNILVVQEAKFSCWTLAIRKKFVKFLFLLYIKLLELVYFI